MTNGPAPRRPIKQKLVVFFAVYLCEFLGLSRVLDHSVPWFAITVSLIVQAAFIVWQRRHITAR